MFLEFDFYADSWNSHIIHYSCWKTTILSTTKALSCRVCVLFFLSFCHLLLCIIQTSRSNAGHQLLEFNSSQSKIEQHLWLNSFTKVARQIGLWHSMLFCSMSENCIHCDSNQRHRLSQLLMLTICTSISKSAPTSNVQLIVVCSLIVVDLNTIGIISIAVAKWIYTTDSRDHTVGFFFWK